MSDGSYLSCLLLLLTGRCKNNISPESQSGNQCRPHLGTPQSKHQGLHNCVSRQCHVFASGFSVGREKEREQQTATLSLSPVYKNNHLRSLHAAMHSKWNVPSTSEQTWCSVSMAASPFPVSDFIWFEIYSIIYCIDIFKQNHRNSASWF